jgi:hypothetical protein
MLFSVGDLRRSPGRGPPSELVTMKPRQPSPQPRIHEKRRGVRLNSRVPVAVEWDTPGSETQRVEAFTRVVNPYGCLVVLSADLVLEQRLRVVNLATESANSGVIVWKGHHRTEGWEIGIELTQPPMDFWGLEL